MMWKFFLVTDQTRRSATSGARILSSRARIRLERAEDSEKKPATDKPDLTDRIKQSICVICVNLWLKLFQSLFLDNVFFLTNHEREQVFLLGFRHFVFIKRSYQMFRGCVPIRFSNPETFV